MYTPTPCVCQLTNLTVNISSAEKKTTDNNNKSFVVYTITTNIETIKEAKRRYSEFEALRKLLVRLYPTTLIPPIPEKHSISEYAAQKQSKDDSNMIDKRKRMLSRFLSRLIQHPILNQEHVVHCFLDGKYSWQDILDTAPVLNLPKDPLLTDTTYMTLSNQIIPVPSSSYTLKYPNKEFITDETQVDKSAQHASAHFEKSQKRIIHRLSDLSNDYADLGSAYNALSLNETGVMAASIEKIGQVVDGSRQSLRDMVHSLEIDFAEHVQDYTQYIHIAHHILKYRHLKQAQLELIEEVLETKKSALRGFLRTEEEAQKLDLDQRLTINKQKQIVEEECSNIDTESIEDGFSAVIKRDNEQLEDQEEEEQQYPTSVSAPMLKASKNQTKKWSTRKLFSAVTYTIQGMIDTDPEQTRRNQISKLKDVIVQLEEAKVTTRQDLKEMSLQIHQDFERLQVQKQAELKSMLIAFAKIHMQYCEQNMVTWKEMRRDVGVTMDSLLE